MTITEIHAKSLLRKQKKVDSWFISRYGMNLYRGCTHDCVYCDGRAEKYNVGGEFGQEVAVKVNAIELLRKELDPKRKRKPLPRGFIMLGGGVGDSYQPAEHQYELARQALQVIADYNFPVHILTKSTLVERDLDLLTAINKKSRVMLSMSFSSVDDEISALVEPGVPSPTERLKTLAKFKQAGFACGMFLMPVIPLLTDTPQRLEESLRAASQARLDYVIFGGMTLKAGRQKTFFEDVVFRRYPEFAERYRAIYPDNNQYGAAAPEYYQALDRTFVTLANRYRLPKRIPARVFHDILDDNDLVVVILEQLEYLSRLQGRNSPYGYAAYSIAQLKEPLSLMEGTLQTLKGVGPVTERIIREILTTRTSAYYEKLL